MEVVVGRFYPFSEAKIGTNEGEWYRNQEPEGQQGYKGGEGDCRWTTLAPQD